MRKYITGMLIAMLVFTAMLPLQVRADGQEALHLEAEGEGVKVRLTLPGADGQMLSSLQLSLNVTSDTAEKLEASFQFDSSLSGKALVQEARYQAETGVLNVYIAGREPLFAKGEETITLGKVIAADGAFTVEAKEDSLTLAEGSSKRTIKLERLPQPVLAGDKASTGDVTAPGNEGGESKPMTPAATGNEQLQQAVNAAKGYTKNNYTADSYSALEEAVKNAEGILNDPDAAQEERDAALQSLQNAAGALEDKTPTSAEKKQGQKRNAQETGWQKEPVPVILYVLIALLLLVIAGVTVYGIRYKRKEEAIYK